MKTELSFHGAAGGVTGSCYRLKTSQADVLIDCGLFQGSKTLKALNYNRFPFDPRHIDAVLLTHAHIDHSGQLPKLMRAGFDGPIYATDETRDLCEIMLADCGHIQEAEVEHLNRRNAQRGAKLVEPIYTAKDAARTLRMFSITQFDTWLKVAPGIKARWWNAGHILGSASVEIEVETDGGPPLRLMFSGDLGPGGRDFLADPEGPTEGIDYLVLESTYGGTVRQPIDPDTRRAILAQELRDAHARGGPLLMPAFAVERTQELLADLLQIMEDREAPAGDIFLDSPLAIKASEIYFRHGWNGVTNPFEHVRASGQLHYLEKPWDSDKLEQVRGWHIIMAGSGMCDAGRVRKHLKRLLWRKEATVLLTGFQAVGTLGRLLLDGRRDIRIQGEPIRVRATIRDLDIYSGHADAPALERWAKARGAIHRNLFLTHGEPEALRALLRRLSEASLSEEIIIPDLDDRFVLSAGGSERQKGEPRMSPESVAALDWHNARSELLSSLDEVLEHAGSDADRARIIESLMRKVRPAITPS